MIVGKDATRYFDEKETCPICQKLGIYWTYFQDPGYEDEGYPLPEELKQLILVEGSKEALEGEWIKKCPECGKLLRHYKHLTYCIHYVQEYESCMQVDYWNVQKLLNDPKMTLSELEELYEKDKLIIYLKAILNDDSYPDHHRAVLEYLLELNRAEAIPIMKEHLADSNPKWREYVSKMLKEYETDR